MSAVLSSPLSVVALPRQQTPLVVAVALHAALLLVLLNGLKPAPVEMTTPREVIVALVAQSRDTPSARAEPISARQPEPLARSTPAPRPMPQPVLQSTPAPTPVARASAPDQPTPLTTPAPQTAHAAAPASATAAPAAVATAPAPAPIIEPKAAPVQSHPTAPPQAAAERGPMTVSSVEYLQPPKPVYPLSAKRAGEQGKVIVRVLVDDNGRPERADIRESAGYPKLDEAAREAVLRASFKPHVEDGHAVPVYVLVPISFNLR